VEDPLGGIIGIGLGQSVWVFFFGDFGPVVEVEGDFDKSGVCNIQFLVNSSHRFVVFGRGAVAPDGREELRLFRDNGCYVLVKPFFTIVVRK